MDKIDSWLTWKHDPICKLSKTEWIRYQDRFGDIEHSSDGGQTWKRLPWTIGRANRILLWIARETWPPFIDCFGFYEGKVAIAWHSTSSEDELHVAKFIATFDERQQRWKSRYKGFYALGDAGAQTWFEGIGFTVLNPMKPALE